MAELAARFGVHPTMIVQGYEMAAEKAVKVLEDMAREVSTKDRDLLEKIALTAMTGKLAGAPDVKIAKDAVDMVLAVTEETEEGKKVVSLKNVIVEKKAGESMEDSELFQGIIIDKERVHDNMPKKVEGAKIAIDDFGSGYSNYAYLMKLGVDIVKIDGSLVADITTNLNNKRIVKSIINIIHDLGMEVVTEFVKDREIYQMVVLLGTDYAQGHFIEKATNLDVTALLRRGEQEI